MKSHSTLKKTNTITAKLKKSRKVEPVSALKVDFTKNNTPKTLQPGLYIVSTPIGNAEDLSFRALRILENVNAVICEDTRVTKRLLKMYKISNNLVIYNDYNAVKVRRKILDRLINNEILAIVSDAGSPLISDPGYKLVAACILKNIPITVAPGPSAVLAALTISGLPTDKFFFHGFLSKKLNVKRETLESLKTIPGSLIFFEAGSRLRKTLIEIKKILGNRNAAITRELTKTFEEVKRGKLENLLEFYETNRTPKGEITIVVGPKTQKSEVSEKKLVKMITETLKNNSVKNAVKIITLETGLSKRIVYQKTLEINLLR